MFDDAAMVLEEIAPLRVPTTQEKSHSVSGKLKLSVPFSRRQLVLHNLLTEAPYSCAGHR